MTTRTPLRRDLADLKQKVYLFGEKCLEVSELYNSLLESNSNPLEKKLLNLSSEIKKESKVLNDQCFLVLTLQQPLIKDLRFVIGSLQIVLNLEKTQEQYLSTLSLISDLNVLETTIKQQLITMAKKAEELLRTSLLLYLSFNLSAQEDFSKIFSEITYLHNILYKRILSEVAEVKGQKAQIEAQLLSTIRSLEKIADLTLNICEQVKYIILGKAETEPSKHEA